MLAWTVTAHLLSHAAAASFPTYSGVRSVYEDLQLYVVATAAKQKDVNHTEAHRWKPFESSDRDALSSMHSIVNESVDPK